MTTHNRFRAATDVGGTFTDLVSFETECGWQPARGHRQVRHHPAQLRRGRAERAGQGRDRPGGSRLLAHGTTVVINALTERKGVKVGLITTEGFRDTLEIARGNRPDFFNLHYEKPAPFVPRHLRARTAGPHGLTMAHEREPLDLSGLARHPRRLSRRGRQGHRGLLPAFLCQSGPRGRGDARPSPRLWPEVSVGRLPSDHPRMARV